MRRIVLLVLFLAVPAFGRDLYWEELRVAAHLDGDGALHVTETQVMVFDGDWNGGERRFNVRPGEQLTFEGIERIDGRARTIALEEGSLDEVDNFAWSGDQLLRWRSRDEDDPPFRDAQITYVLRYTLSSILQRNDAAYVLHHNFVFPEREGRIERVHVKLTLDPVWEPVEPMNGEWTAGPLPPGESFVLEIPLRYSGDGTPAVAPAVIASDGAGDARGSAPRGVPPGDPLPWMLFSLAVVPPLMLTFSLLREWRAERLEKLRPEDVSLGWLQQHVLRTKPEILGALWDSDVGEAEVAAVLARLVAEEKIESRLEGKDLHMTLKVPRGEFKEYEWLLVDALFPNGDTTSTKLIRTHYKETGLNPAKVIKENLEEKFVEPLMPKGEPLKPWGWPLTTFWLASIAVLVYAAMQPGGYLIASVGTFFISLFACAFALIGPAFWQKRVDFGVMSAILLMLPAFAMVAFAAAIISMGAADPDSELRTVPARLGVTMMALWLFGSAAHTLRTRTSRESLALRKRLATAREFFRRELAREKPSLQDVWYPYVVAFGLGGAVEKWFRQFGGVSTDTRFGHSGSTSSFGSSSGISSWTGGGGAFGGAGASGSWVGAVAGVAAGVSAPSSSSSGSSSSGGSSGGGGGGGW